MTTILDDDARWGWRRDPVRRVIERVPRHLADADGGPATLPDGWRIVTTARLMDAASASAGSPAPDPATAARDRAEGARDAAYARMIERSANAWKAPAITGLDGMATFRGLADRLPPAVSHLPRKEFAIVLTAVGRLEHASPSELPVVAADLRSIASHIRGMAGSGGLTADGPRLLHGIADHLAALADTAQGAVR